MPGLGYRLRLARERRKLKQTEVMDKVGINNKTLSGYENEVSEPDTDTLKILANLYDVSLDWLVGNKKESTYALPNSIFNQIIRETEEKYNVNLHDDPAVLDAMKNLLDSLGRMKSDR